MKLLLIEDEPGLSESIITYLKGEGYVCESSANYHDAYSRTGVYEYDCVIVDITLPGGSGLDLIKKLKEDRSAAGIIIISAKNALDDKINGLELGADDYITKPFSLSELNARIKSVLRRRKFQGSNVISFDKILVKTDNNEVIINGQPIDLTKKEYQLLIYFLSN